MANSGTMENLKRSGRRLSGTIALKGLRFHAFHGCFGFEREKGGEYVVDFSASQCGTDGRAGGVDLVRAAASDALGDTLDYSEIYGIISDVMSSPSDLIENVTGRIMSRVSEKYPDLGEVSVTVKKLSPPIEGIGEGYAEFTLVSVL